LTHSQAFIFLRLFAFLHFDTKHIQNHAVLEETHSLPPIQKKQIKHIMLYTALCEQSGICCE